MKTNIVKAIAQKLCAPLLGAAMLITAMNVNSTCMYMIHQPKLPQTANKLRKF